MQANLLSLIMSFMIGYSLTLPEENVEANRLTSEISSNLDLHHRRTYPRNMTRRLLREVGQCHIGRESKCRLVFSRHHESIESIQWIKAINHNITKTIMNSGTKLHRNHAVCESRMWANVGREAFKYISYILDNYNSPQNFAPITVFCQIKPIYSGYTEELFVEDVHRLCLKANNSSDVMKWGFEYLGQKVLRFAYGFGNESPAPELFRKLFNSTIDEPYKMKFVPGGCFAVTKENILSNSENFYYRLLSISRDTYHALNEENAPRVGYMYERSWPRIMKSDCEKKQPWCCHKSCNMTAVHEWEKLTNTSGLNSSSLNFNLQHINKTNLVVS